MWLPQVDGDDVGPVTGLDAADLAVHVQSAGSVDGDHFQRLPGRDQSFVPGMALVQPHALEHAAKHVGAAIRRRAVTAEHHRDAAGQQVRHWAIAAYRGDGGWIVHHGGVVPFQAGDIFFGQVDAM